MEQRNNNAKRINLTKWRLLWILIAAAWLFVILKLLIGALFEKNTSLVAAFSVTNPEEISAAVEITARYPDEYLTDEQKQQVIEVLADKILLNIDGELEVLATETRQEMSVSKDAKAASTELKVISLLPEEGDTANHYVYARVSLKESMETVLTYKTLLEEAMRELSCTEISTTIQLVGDYAGYLTLDRRNELTDKILDALGAEVVYEYRETDLYTIYAYTASLDNYITVEGKKINLHIAMSQDEEHYRTILYLASPILPDTW